MTIWKDKEKEIIVFFRWNSRYYWGGDWGILAMAFCVETKTFGFGWFSFVIETWHEKPE